MRKIKISDGMQTSPESKTCIIKCPSNSYKSNEYMHTTKTRAQS
jgi:hypothetical protein